MCPSLPSVSGKSGADSNFTHLQQLELLHAHDTAETAVQNNLSLHFSTETTLHFPCGDKMISPRTALIHWQQSQSEGLEYRRKTRKSFSYIPPFLPHTGIFSISPRSLLNKSSRVFG